MPGRAGRLSPINALLVLAVGGCDFALGRGLSLKNEEFLTFEMPLLDLDMLLPG
jgi:hypothetical protein